MSFGFSIGDFFAVGQFAWSVYKSCKGAGGEFEQVSHEVISLHTVLKELQDEAENPDSVFNRSGAGKKTELVLLVQNCNGVLQQLHNLLVKYKSLGTKNKRPLDRLRMGMEDIVEIREKIMSYRSSLALFLTTLGTGSLGRIEKKLDQLIEDVRAGKRADSVLSMADKDDDAAEMEWDLWKRELVDDGFTKAEVEGHKNGIKAKLMERIESNPNLRTSASRGLEFRTNPGEEVGYKEKFSHYAGTETSNSTHDWFLPTDSISNWETNTIKTPSIQDIRTSHPVSPIASQPSPKIPIKNNAAEHRPDLRGSDLDQLRSPPAQEDPSWDSFDDDLRSSEPFVEAWYTPKLPTPTHLFGNRVVEKPLLLTLEELFTGTHKKIRVKNRKSLRETVCEIDVEPGLARGTKFKFENLEDIEDGGQLDLYWIVDEKNHRSFTREGDDLHLEVELSLQESLCGWKRVVQTIDGSQIKIEKPGPTQPGSWDSYPGLGMPISSTPIRRGDFIVKYTVKYPTSLSHFQRAKLQQALKVFELSSGRHGGLETEFFF